ncbi:hypothetical protein ACFVYG_20405 [Streptomyces sp. NPDC058256]|uniref:hypothetical protein n=1 Tax=Streptomyces sp. NPDC058256 TaxID=3346408 RepID=UPI0036E8DC48
MIDVSAPANARIHDFLLGGIDDHITDGNAAATSSASATGAPRQWVPLEMVHCGNEVSPLVHHGNG